MRWEEDLRTKAERIAAGAAGSGESLKVANLIQLLVDSPRQIRRLSLADASPAEELLFGLDGDDTGAVLEELFLSASDEERFTQLSGAVSAAIEEICHKIQVQCASNRIIFAAGDDILFKGRVNAAFLDDLQRTYLMRTGGLTCSIGYGRSFREVYLALKMAKAQPGKNCITGIDLL